jgi:hypothetical protein
MALRGGEIFNQPAPRPVTLPTIELADIDVEEKRRPQPCAGRGANNHERCKPIVHDGALSP